MSPGQRGAVGQHRPRTLRLSRYSLRFDRRAAAVCLLLAVGMVVIGGVTLMTGEYQVAPAAVWRTLTGNGTDGDRFIILTLRLPRLITAILVGAALGVGGAIFQSITRNALGSPDIVGFNTGAATGALIAILLWHGTMTQAAVGAVIGGMATALAVYVLAMKRGVQGNRLILVGIGVAAMLTSVNWYLLTRSAANDAQVAAAWITGSLNNRTWDHVTEMLWATVILLPAALWCGRWLRTLELGDDLASGLGVPVERARLISIVVGVGLCALAIAAAGPIAFISLAAPQIARRLTRSVGPGIAPAAVTGAFLLVAADLLAQRLFAPMQLPVGVATGAIGGIYLAWLLGQQWRGGRG